MTNVPTPQKKVLRFPNPFGIALTFETNGIAESAVNTWVRKGLSTTSSMAGTIEAWVVHAITKLLN